MTTETVTHTYTTSVTLSPRTPVRTTIALPVPENMHLLARGRTDFQARMDDAPVSLSLSQAALDALRARLRDAAFAGRNRLDLDVSGDVLTRTYRNARPGLTERVLDLATIHDPV